MKSNNIKFVVGVDEVGRGSLAGPVVAAAVLGLSTPNSSGWYKDVKDSKLILESKREVLGSCIKNEFAFAIGKASPEEIDKLNIHNATLLAMKRALVKLDKIINLKDYNILVDGKFIIKDFNFGSNQSSIIKGDNKVFAISAASIVAKVYRDGLMKKYSKEFNLYGLEQNKGYGTSYHMSQIQKFGLCKIHRKSFCKKFETN